MQGSALNPEIRDMAPTLDDLRRLSGYDRRQGMEGNLRQFRPYEALRDLSEYFDYRAYSASPYTLLLTLVNVLGEHVTFSLLRLHMLPDLLRVFLVSQQALKCYWGPILLDNL